MKNKLLAVFVAIGVLLCCVGCQKSETEAIDETVTVYITVGAFDQTKQADDYELYLTDTLPYTGQNAANYFRTLCNQNDLAVTGVDDGYISEIGDYKNNDTEAWMFYCDDGLTLSEKGVGEVIPSPDDVIVLSYIDWTALFS